MNSYLAIGLLLALIGMLCWLCARPKKLTPEQQAAKQQAEKSAAEARRLERIAYWRKELSQGLGMSDDDPNFYVVVNAEAELFGLLKVEELEAFVAEMAALRAAYEAKERADLEALQIAEDRGRLPDLQALLAREREVGNDAQELAERIGRALEGPEREAFLNKEQRLTQERVARRLHEERAQLRARLAVIGVLLGEEKAS